MRHAQSHHVAGASPDEAKVLAKVLKRGAPQAQGEAPAEAACGHRFVLSVPGFGYSSRLRQLLSCGSVVVHVPGDWDEL